MVIVYRPPGTTTDYFDLALFREDKWISDLNSEFSDVDVLVTGDLNLGSLKDWDNVFLSEFSKKVKDRRGKDGIIGEDTAQTVTLIDFSLKWRNSTHDGRIIDLVFTNYVDMIRKKNHDNTKEYRTMIH